ncbi:SurA N-terminal domain-containing protein [Alteromonas sp. a30]|uniref:SurA N-terminal domain-containing protein n=1 Tax=Alteromonas sp. a30 TaxID=2730917 RepID=UPI0022823CA5|nr:SurA N-terminal domain-containing protein [Alteromonas sp. a30]MCY7295978.1 peptidylprolyl isomerase [Alteromonas sp. a30]
MLEKMREGATGIFAKVVLGLVILSFVFAGVGSYINSGSEVPAAVVNGEEISSLTLERAYQNERGRMESQLGELFSQLAANPEYLSNFRQQILERLVSEELLDQFATESGMRVSDEDVKRAIIETPAFQLGGQFDNERFKLLIAQSGMQVNEFKELLRGDLTRRQLSDAVLASNFTLPSEAKSALRLQKQTRTARVVKVPASLFSDSIEINDEERNAYYSANITDFDTQEKVKVEYIELEASQLASEMEVTEQEIEDYYQSNQSRYRSDEQRRVSHILVELGDDEEASLENAQGLLDIARTGADFASLAKENSADTFSGENGGDLDWIEKGQMDPAFEEAAFSLAQVGDISDVVKSEFGFHIIKLTDLKEEQVKELEDVADEIRLAIKQEKAVERFYDIQTQVEELAFEVPDSLGEVAAVANVDVMTSALFSRDEAEGVLANPILLEQVFSENAIDEKINSDVLSLGDNHIVVVRVIEHSPRRTQALEEVKMLVDAALTQEKALEAAKDWANEVKHALVETGEAETLLASKELAWETHEAIIRASNEVDPEVRTALFKLSQDDKFDVVELAGGDVALVELQEIANPEQFDENEVKSTQQRLARQIGASSFQSMLEELKASADITYAKTAETN